MGSLLVGVLAYVAVQLVIGAVVARRVRTEDDYLVAGRSLGPLLATVSIFATWFGAETCVGASGAAYEDGVGRQSDEPFAYGLCLIAMALVFAVPMWRSGITTLGDLFRKRFDGRTEKLAAIVLIPTSLFWASAQIHAFGKVLASTSPDLGFESCLAIAAGIVIVYTASGGLMADVITDLLQGGVLVLGLVVLTVIVLTTHHDGQDALTLALGPRPASHPQAPPLGLLDTLETWALPIFGSITAQEALSRSLAARTPRIARNSGIAAGLLYLLVGLMPVFLGLVAAHRHPDLEHADTALSVIARDNLPSLGYVMFAGALVSAILSTVDSSLLAAGSVFSRNLVLAGRTDVSERTRVLCARGSVVLFGVAAWALAHSADNIMDMIDQTSGFGASVFVCVVFGLFSRFGRTIAASGTLVGGTWAWIHGNWIDEWSWPFLTTLAIALLCYLVGGAVDALLTPRPGRAAS